MRWLLDLEFAVKIAVVLWMLFGGPDKVVTARLWLAAALLANADLLWRWPHSPLEGWLAGAITLIFLGRLADLAEER